MAVCPSCKMWWDTSAQAEICCLPRDPTIAIPQSHYDALLKVVEASRGVLHDRGLLKAWGDLRDALDALEKP